MAERVEGNVNRCVCCGNEIPESTQVCGNCVETDGKNPLQPETTGNQYYDYLIHEVQVVCNCDKRKAMAIVSYVNSLGSNPIEFIRKLPDYVGEQHPDADEVLVALENIREDHGIARYGICFPEGYVNRAERRRQEKQRKKEGKRCGH